MTTHHPGGQDARGERLHVGNPVPIDLRLHDVSIGWARPESRPVPPLVILAVAARTRSEIMSCRTFEYHFYRPGSTEDIIATFSTAEPLPHIQVGNSLVLESDRYSTTTGYHQVINHVEMYLGILKDDQAPAKVRIGVYLGEADRAEILQG
jgi:hypothetical protein